MRNIVLLAIITGCFLAFSCTEKESERFRLLTTTTWAPDSLLANGVDASGPGGLLEDFLGDANFNEDGTGTFGQYTGTWKFNIDETELIISTESFAIPIVADIVELTSQSLKVTTVLPNPQDLQNPFDIRMTFKAK